MSNKLGKVFLVKNIQSCRIEEGLKNVVNFTNNWDDADTVMIYITDLKFNKSILERNIKVHIQSTNSSYMSKITTPIASPYGAYQNHVSPDLCGIEASIISTFIKARYDKKKVVLMSEFACITIATLFKFPIVFPTIYKDDKTKHYVLSNHIPGNIINDDLHLVTYSMDGNVDCQYIKSNHTFLINPGLDNKYKKGIDYEVFSTSDCVKKYRFNLHSDRVIEPGVTENGEYHNIDDEIASFYVPKHKCLFILDDCFSYTNGEEYAAEPATQYVVDMLTLFEEKFV